MRERGGKEEKGEKEKECVPVGPYNSPAQSPSRPCTQTPNRPVSKPSSPCILNTQRVSVAAIRGRCFSGSRINEAQWGNPKGLPAPLGSCKAPGGV